jgi:RHS repeat-associated protein
MWFSYSRENAKVILNILYFIQPVLCASFILYQPTTTVADMENSLAGFNGQRPDPVSGHYHLGNGYRAYSPVLGRFTCPDDMSPFGPGGINPYTYCGGDPVNRTDPSGHFSLGQGIGMALGFVAGIALSVLTEGAAMPVVLTLMATVAGDAAIGAGAELATEAIDGHRINWGQVGIAAGVSAAASLIRFGVGSLSKQLSTRNPLASNGKIVWGINERNIRVIGDSNVQAPGGTGLDVNYLFEDNYRGKLRLNIFAHGAFYKKLNYVKVKVEDGSYLSGDNFAKYLTEEHGIIFSRYDYARLVICKSGRGGIKSFAAKFSRESLLPTKGFNEDVVTNDILGGIAYDIKNGSMKNGDAINSKLAELSFENPTGIFRVIKDDPKYPYDPAKFRYPPDE